MTPVGMAAPTHKEFLKDEWGLVSAGMFGVCRHGTVFQIDPGAIVTLARAIQHGFHCVSRKPGAITWVGSSGFYAQTFLRACPLPAT